jgi:ribosomal-protein-alanine N-acetyltransferase
MIHILSQKHITECTDLHRLCFDKPWSKTEFSDFFDNDLIITIGTWDNHHLIGLLSVMMFGTEAEIYTLCVHPNYRHKNIGTALIQNIQKECKDRLITHIFLEVSVLNISAVKCYEKNHFKIINTRKDYYRKNNILTDAYVMQYECYMA